MQVNLKTMIKWYNSLFTPIKNNTRIWINYNSNNKCLSSHNITMKNLKSSFSRNKII